MSNSTLAQKSLDLSTEVKRAISHSRTLVSQFDSIQQQLIKTNERTQTAGDMDIQIWKVWSYVRENPKAMDSGKICAKVRSIIESAVADIQKRLEEKTTELHSEREKSKELRRELRTLKEDHKTMMTQLTVKDKQIRELTKKGRDLESRIKKLANCSRSPFQTA